MNTASFNSVAVNAIAHYCYCIIWQISFLAFSWHTFMEHKLIVCLLKMSEGMEKF